MIALIIDYPIIKVLGPRKKKQGFVLVKNLGRVSFSGSDPRHMRISEYAGLRIRRSFTVEWPDYTPLIWNPHVSSRKHGQNEDRALPLEPTLLCSWEREPADPSFSRICRSLNPAIQGKKDASVSLLCMAGLRIWFVGDLYDAVAIFLAFQSPEVDVIGLTTIYGNVYTTLATRNALHLLEVAERTEIPVAEGSHVTLMNVTKLRIADFVHGADGLGNLNFSPPKGKPIEQSAAAFLVNQANLHPGEVTVVALGPLTNIALAIELDPEFPKKIGQIVILGGAFSVNGNVNPASEANIFGDPEAADNVFTCGADILTVGINVTHQVVMTDTDRKKLENSKGKFAQYLCKILGFYFSYHSEAYSTSGVYLHDPTALLAAINPSLFTYIEGVVRVQKDGIMRGLTIFDSTKKRYGEITEWSNKPIVKVAVTVDAEAVLRLLMERLMNS